MSDARHSCLLYKSRERTYFWDFYALESIVAYDMPLPFYDLPNLELLFVYPLFWLNAKGARY
jgi:hypothetical protein